jgi:lysozyme family protein
MAWTFEATARGYANLFLTAKLKGGTDAAQADIFADKIIAAEQRYRAVQNATGVPWFFIGALHMRESSCNFAGVLHNGDKIIGTGGLTTRVPAGRGPFSTWEESAIDALKLKDMHRVQHWSAPRMLFQSEEFNGPGYRNKGVNSPYVWAGTNHEQLGKYIADHVWDSTHDDTQLGVAAVLIRLAEKRPDIAADLYPSTTEKPPVDDTDQTTNKQVLDALNAMRSELPGAIASAIMAAMKGAAQGPAVDPKPVPVVEPKPAPAPVPVPEPVPVTPPTATTPILERPTVGLGILSGALALIMQMFGVPVVGEGATAVTQAPLAVAISSGALGLSGAGGGIFNAIGTAISLFQNMRAQKK